MIKRLMVISSIVLLVIAFWLQRTNDYTIAILAGEPLLLSGCLIVGSIALLILTIIVGVMSSCG